jgi:glycosyltransferase involved in cell wall biosynthesis
VNPRQAPAAGTFLVAQMGARMHYAVPRIFEAAGLLAGLYTDICSARGWPRLLRLVPRCWRPAGLRRLLGRDPAGVPAGKIQVFPAFAWQWRRRRAAAASDPARRLVDLWAGRRFCEHAVRAGLRGAAAVYTFNSAGLELLRFARRQGLRTVVEQTMAPHAVERRLLQEQRQRFPGWEGALPPDSCDEFCEREQAEWELADFVLCGSPFVREAMASAGAATSCVVVPYGVDEHFAVPDRPPRDGPLRVLTVGAVGLRKGSPDVLATASQLKGIATFRMVGPAHVSPAVERDLQARVDLRGVVPRAEVVGHYAWADVFLLPSVCEGSATATYEALACGLPVVCTPNTGSVVRDGVDGFLVPVGAPAAIAEHLGRLAADRTLLRRLADNARQRAADFTLARYRHRLLEAVTRPPQEGQP